MAEEDARTTAAAPEATAKEGKKKRRKRIRSPHPGVVLIKRKWTGGTSWRARWTDPDTGRETWDTLDSQAVPDEDARTLWAKEKSKSLAVRRAEVASGAPRRTRTALAEAVEGFLKAGESRLRPATVATYRSSTAPFLAWAKRNGIATAEALTGPALVDYRESLIATKARRPAAGERSGAKKETEGRRSPVFVNRLLREAATVLGELRRQGRTPHLSRDVIADSLRRLPEPRPLPRPLSPADCAGVLRAALAHDATTWKVTRAEHRANPSAVAVNGTPRYRAVAPLAAFVLLSGCRIGEALGLRWEDVNLDAPGEDGMPAGEVRLLSGAVKTAQERVVDLSIAPGLRALLARLRLQAGTGAYVFGGEAPYPRDDAENARKRIIGEKYGAPRFSWQQLRQTTASYLVNAPGIFRSAAIYRAAAQLGHSSAVADRHYRGVLRGIPVETRTLEVAMGIEGLLPDVARTALSIGQKSATA